MQTDECEENGQLFDEGCSAMLFANHCIPCPARPWGLQPRPTVPGHNCRRYMRLCPPPVVLPVVLACHIPPARSGAISEQGKTPSSLTFPPSQAEVSAGIINPGPRPRAGQESCYRHGSCYTMCNPSRREIESYWRGFEQVSYHVCEEGCLLQNRKSVLRKLESPRKQSNISDSWAGGCPSNGFFADILLDPNFISTRGPPRVRCPVAGLHCFPILVPRTSVSLVSVEISEVQPHRGTATCTAISWPDLEPV